MPNVDFNLNSNAANSIESVAGLIANVVNQYIVTPENAPPGVSGFVFDIIDDEEIILDSDITDNYVEQNFAVQDHWAQKPIRFTLRGFVGELNDILQIEVLNAISIIKELVPVADLLPDWNVQDAQIYRQIADINTQAQVGIGQITSVATLINQFSVNVTRQHAAYNIFYGMWVNRQLCTIQTPFGLLTSMGIESIHSLQGGASRYMSDFSVSFKQIKVVSTFIIPGPSKPNPAGSGTTQAPAASTTQPGKIQNNTTTPPQSLPIPDQTQEKGRVLTMTAPIVDLGKSSGVANIPNTNPPLPVTVPTILPNNNPMFATLPSQNKAMPGFVPFIPPLNPMGML